MVCILGNFNLVKEKEVVPSAERTQSETKASSVQRVFKKIDVYLVRRSKKPISSFVSSFKHSLMQPILASNSLCS